MGIDINALARAYMERERQRVGIPQQEQAAAESETGIALKRIQAVRALQELGLAPDEQESQNALRGAQTRYYEAGAGARETPKAGTAHYETNAAGVTTAITPQPDGTFKKESLGGIGTPQRPPNPDRVLVQTWTGGYDPQGNPIMQFQPRSEVGGTQHPAPPTTAQRNVEAGTTTGQQNLAMARQRAAPILADLGSRILQLNSGNEGGFVDRVGGMARSTASRMGMDSAVDLFRTGARGFAPLLANAVGHKGVLTEIDVQRTEDLFPRVGDSDATTREKLARLQRIVMGTEPLPFAWEQPVYDEAGVTQPGAAAAGGGSGFRVLGVRPKQ